MFDKPSRLRYSGLMNDNPNRVEDPDGETRGRMQRVRVGLTGLAVVLIIIALATALTRHDSNSIVAANSANVAALPSKDEPLADLGVAPGAAIEGTNQNDQMAPQ